MHKDKRNHAVCNKMDRTGNHHDKSCKPDSERQIASFLLQVESRFEKKKTVKDKWNYLG
jgi:hypothetical protein